MPQLRIRLPGNIFHERASQIVPYLQVIVIPCLKAVVLLCLYLPPYY